MKTRLSLILVCLAALAAAAVATEPESDDAGARLVRVAERYRAMASYDLRGRMVMRVKSFGNDQSIEGILRIAGIRPDLQFTGVEGDPAMTMQIVTRPDSIWTFMGLMDQYTVEPASVKLDGGVMSGGVTQYLMLEKRAAGSHIVRKEFLQTPTGEHPCVVIALAPDTTEMSEGVSVAQAETLWVDAERDLVLRHARGVSGGTMIMVGTVDFDDAGFGATPPDSLFVFTPPPGAKRVVEFKGPQTPEITKPAPGPAASFTLADLAGKQVSLADFKGKVVLLDFWATWCGPCRIELPHVDKLSRELAGKGLVVLAITAESRELAASYLEKNKLGLRCLIDADGKVNESYGIRAIPTVVVIDRNGNVSDFLIGLQTEKSLLAAVKKAGLD